MKIIKYLIVAIVAIVVIVMLQDLYSATFNKSLSLRMAWDIPTPSNNIVGSSPPINSKTIRTDGETNMFYRIKAE